MNFTRNVHGGHEIRVGAQEVVILLRQRQKVRACNARFAFISTLIVQSGTAPSSLLKSSTVLRPRARATCLDRFERIQGVPCHDQDTRAT